VTAGGGKTQPCAACHGADWHGTDTVPGLAGKSPVYVARQIYLYRNGERKGASGAIMKTVVDGLSDHDIVAIAAYLASRPPS
jgi:cytochrome c553